MTPSCSPDQTEQCLYLQPMLAVAQDLFVWAKDGVGEPAMVAPKAVAFVAWDMGLPSLAWARGNRGEISRRSTILTTQARIAAPPPAIS
jgi:hypothetical protein